MRYCTLLILFFFSVQAQALSSKDLRSTLGEDHWFLGVALAYLVPNQLPNFESAQLVMGPQLGIPLGKDHLAFQFSYGSGSGDSLTLKDIEVFEAGYRYAFHTPFLSGFAIAGGHYTSYLGNNQRTNRFGPFGGFGFYFPMAKDFTMGVDMKGYFLDKLVLGFGGGFAFSL